MKIQFGRRFWIVETAVIVVHGVRWGQRPACREDQAADQRPDTRAELGIRRRSRQHPCPERLKYDDYLEEYARENYHMQGRNEHVYIIRE